MKIGEKIWHCSRTSDENAEVETFDEPVEYTLRFGYFTVQPKNTYTDIMAYGERNVDYQRGIAQPYNFWKDKIKIGDRFYLDGNKPDETEEFYGENANFTVDGVSKQNMAIEITFKKL